MDEPLQTVSDGGILLQVAEGVERAMEGCISRYGGLVWSITRRYVGDRGAAEEVVQEIFTELWRCAGRYDPSVAKESTFVSMLARRRAIDWLRKQSRQPVLDPLPEVDAIPIADDDPSPSRACETEDVRRAVDHLPDETRNLFDLHFDQGLTHPEIAEKTGMPLGTVKTRLRRGLIEVRNHLRRLEGGGELLPSSS